MVVIGDEPGEVNIEVTTHQAAPPLDLDSWDSIEEAGAEFEPDAIEANNLLDIDFTDDLRDVLTTIPAGATWPANSTAGSIISRPNYPAGSHCLRRCSTPNAKNSTTCTGRSKRSKTGFPRAFS
ncbi:hypothetical protein [Williamsia muralis]|uniref:Uncharacterized protein n=1 Tax=Williamsia marianensis TaxID=85044 RepID=A0ABU4F0Y3_WILMA|nr:hypothetical protein [Williamsia muralis]MDV7137161.1 hypothetical protein [Williamsia muralis]